MGSLCSKPGVDNSERDRELQDMKTCLALLLKQLSPDELLTFVTEDNEIYEICRDDHHLRANCIIGAVRRYHCEKFFYEEVHNRTADYMVMLDQFVEIQDEYEKQLHRYMEQQELKMQRRRNNIFLRCIYGIPAQQEETADNDNDNDNNNDNDRQEEENNDDDLENDNDQQH